MRRGLIVILTSLVIASAIGLYLMTTHQGARNVELVIKDVQVRFTLISDAFDNGTYIPKKYTCDGENISPPLKWYDAPKGVVSYVLIVYDPDAPRGIFYHWLLYNIPANTTSLPENIMKKDNTPYGFQGINDFGRIGYGGPCPPPGKAHRYIFLLLALDTKVNLDSGASIEDLLRSIRGHVIAYAKLVGLYKRS